VQCHSDFQRDGLCNNGTIELERSYVIPNGYDKDIFRPVPERPVNEKKVFMYSASPDRGLHHVFPIVDRLVAQGLPCELHVFYNVDTVVKQNWYAQDELGLRAHIIADGMKRPYVTNHGIVQRPELAEWYQKADLLLYPCDPVVITEMFCTTVLESLACGCVPLISDVDMLPLYQGVAPMLPVPIDYDVWAMAIKELVSEPQEKRRQLGLEWVKQYRWYRLAPRWERMYKVLMGETNGKDTVADTA
jgi:glycosyltransferase involved in cell wall biosynthesis